MKPFVIVAWLAFIISGNARAQSFEGSLQHAFSRYDTAMSSSSIVAGVSELDAIASKYPDKWAGHFYAAYARIKQSLGLTDKNQRDQLIDKAEAELNTADKLSPNNEELFILRAWCVKARLAVDPPNRWKKCNAQYDDAIGKAKKINAENPRIYFLDGQGYFYRPKLWGGGKDKAKVYFQKAWLLFAKEDKGDILKPSWGEKMNEEFLAKCNN